MGIEGIGYLQTLAASPTEQLWLGDHAPFPMDLLEIRRCTNLRGPASHHGNYGVVWCYETPLSELPPNQLLLFLNEAIRFLKRDGILVARYGEVGAITTVSLKNILGRMYGMRVSVAEEIREAGFTTTAFEVGRENFEAYRSDLWTLGILTLGDRIDYVVAFLRSIRDQDPERRHQIIVCGPEAAEYGPYNVEYIAEVFSTRRAEICRKKNCIARAAIHPNLLLTHDRYKLDAGFFDGFAEFGYDFDFATVKQWFEDREEFPSYCTLSKTSRQLNWELPPIFLKDYSVLHPTHFINGGLMVFKTHTLLQIPFNETQFWNQGEDVELSRAFMERQIAPRINTFSGATTLDTPKAKTAGYLAERTDHREQELYLAALRQREGGVIPTGGVRKKVRRMRDVLKRHSRKVAALVAASILIMQIITLYLVIARR